MGSDVFLPSQLEMPEESDNGTVSVRFHEHPRRHAYIPLKVSRVALL